MSSLRLLAARSVAACSRSLLARPAALIVARAAPSARFHLSSVRLMSGAVDPTAAPPALEKSEVTERVLNVIRKFEKIKDPNAVTATSVFSTDLGLDSLDAVEVVMAFEDEFGIEIPDADADKIQSTADAINYIAANKQAQ